MEVVTWCCRVTNNFVQGPNLDALRLQVATHDAVAAVVHMLHDAGGPWRAIESAWFCCAECQTRSQPGSDVLLWMCSAC